MSRRFLVLGVCCVLLGLQAFTAWSADTSSSEGPAQQAAYRCRRCCGCGRLYSACLSCCPYCGRRAAAAAAAPEEAAPLPPSPFEEEPTTPYGEPTETTETTPPPGAVAAAPTSVAPNMIGDFFRSGGFYYNSYHMVSASSCSSFPGPGAVVGSTKIAENSSPLPQDRLFFNYSFFDSTPLYPGDVDVNRFTPGFEKTFWCGNASVEMRFPMASTLDSSVELEGAPDTSSYEYGDLAITPKVLLCRSSRGAISAGMTITVPTADDIEATMANGNLVIGRIENDTVHLMPFVGFLYTPNPCWFAIGYLNSNTALIDDDDTGLHEVGEIRDTTFQYLDVAVGRWLYRSCQSMCCQRLRYVALIGEVHWNSALEDGDYIEGDTGYPYYDSWGIGNFARDLDIVDATVGLHVRVGDTTITAAYVTPLTDGPETPFDGEFRLIVNRWFGRSSEACGSGGYAGMFP